jgi:hypothetical protein
MPDYSKACVYMIKHNQDYNDDNVYIGSCCNFTRRKCEHKSVCNNPNIVNYNLKIYQTIRENGGWDNWIMLKLHDFPCNKICELKLEERRVIDLYQSKLNTIIPARTLKEWYEDNKEKIMEKQKIYEEKNKEKIKEYRKKYNEEYRKERNEKITCECGTIFSKHHITRHMKTLKHISLMTKK